MKVFVDSVIVYKSSETSTLSSAQIKECISRAIEGLSNTMGRITFSSMLIQPLRQPGAKGDITGAISNAIREKILNQISQNGAIL